MKENVGRLDREIRVLLGLVIAVSGIYLERWWGLVGAFFLLTAIFHWCPFYALFHRSTGRRDGRGGDVHFLARHPPRSAHP